MGEFAPWGKGNANDANAIEQVDRKNIGLTSEKRKGDRTIAQYWLLFVLLVNFGTQIFLHLYRQVAAMGDEDLGAQAGRREYGGLRDENRAKAEVANKQG